MYKRIDGKLYKLIDEQSAMTQLEKVYPLMAKYIDGIKSCEKSIEAFSSQKKKYLEEIEKIIVDAGIEKELIAQLSPDKASALGF